MVMGNGRRKLLEPLLESFPLKKEIRPGFMVSLARIKPYLCGNVGLTGPYSPPNVLSNMSQKRVSQLKEGHSNINHSEA